MTTQFSSQVLSLIEGFAKNMQIREILPASDGSVTFEFARAGRFCFTPSANGSGILLSLKRHRPGSQFDDLRRFLALSRWDSVLGVSLNTGMGLDGGLVLVACIEEDQLDLQLIERCLDRLILLHDEFTN